MSSMTTPNEACTHRTHSQATAPSAHGLAPPKMATATAPASTSCNSKSGRRADEQCQLPHAILTASRTAHTVSDHEQVLSPGAAIRRRHRRGSSPQFTATTTSRTSQRGCASKQHGSQEQLAAIMRSAATMDGRMGGSDGRPIGGVGGHSNGGRERPRPRLENPSTLYDAQSPRASADGDGGCSGATSY